jgi:hypothetical protein
VARFASQLAERRRYRLEILDESLSLFVPSRVVDSPQNR